jgi:hypothetical protein
MIPPKEPDRRGHRSKTGQCRPSSRRFLGRNVTDLERRVRRLRESGLSWAKVAEQLGVCVSTAYGLGHSTRTKTPRVLRISLRGALAQTLVEMYAVSRPAENKLTLEAYAAQLLEQSIAQFRASKLPPKIYNSPHDCKSALQGGLARCVLSDHVSEQCVLPSVS